MQAFWLYVIWLTIKISVLTIHCLHFNSLTVTKRRHSWEPENYLMKRVTAKKTWANANTQSQTFSANTWGGKHPPAAVDSDRQNVVVEALLHHAEDLRLCGDLSALQALEAEQRDGGNCECLERERWRFRGRRRKECSASIWSAFSPLARPWSNGWWSRADIPCWLNLGNLLQIRQTSSQSTSYPRRTPSWNRHF